VDLDASASSSVSGDAERTEAYYGVENVIDAETRFFFNTKRRIDACMNYTRPALAVRTESIKKSYMDAKSRGVKLRYLTEITKDNIDCCKELMEIAYEFRHLKGIMSNFMLSESEYIAPIVFTDEGKIAPEIIYSNIKSFVEQQQYIFDMLWNNAETAEQRIRELEEGVRADFIDTIRDPYQVQRLVFDLVRQAREEILVIFSTANAFQRQIKSGAVESLKEAANLGGVKVRILTPFNEVIKKLVGEWKPKDTCRGNNDDDSGSGSIDGEYVDGLFNIDKLKIRLIEPQLQTKVSILIVDRKYSLSVELKDDTKDTSYEAMGLTSYSNSKSTVLSYVSIFESLWAQLDLYEQLKVSNKQQELLIKRLQAHDIWQKEFINTAAHELRTPVQPILGLADVLGSKKGNIEQYQDFISIIGRNARRLKFLTEDILDVSRIDSKSLELRNEMFDLVSTINRLLDDYRKDREALSKECEISFECKFKNAFVLGDRERIRQVVHNLLDNALKFTKHGSITISLSERKTRNANEWNIVIKDDGKGIDSEIMPRLFTKFATKSEHGIGLGLYISKSIIEAHGGKIWAENNPNGKGATFSFSLPMTN
jgi:signal transduction histidine kinase